MIRYRNQRRLRCRPLFLIIIAGLLLCCGRATATLAATPPTDGPPLSTEVAEQPETTDALQHPPSIATTAAKALGALAVVIGLLVLLAGALRKLGLSGHTPHGSGLIQVLDTRMLAPKKYVAVLDIAGQTLAVGVSDQQITLLTKLKPNERLQAHARSRPSSSRFASLLAKAVNKNKVDHEDHS